MSKKELMDRLREALDIRKKRPVDLCNDLNLAKSTVSQYLSGKSKNMDADRLQSIAEYLNVSEAWLMGYDVPMERKRSFPVHRVLDPDQEELLADYDRLNADGKAAARERVHELTELPKFTKDTESRKLQTS